MDGMVSGKPFSATWGAVSAEEKAVPISSRLKCALGAASSESSQTHRSPRACWPHTQTGCTEVTQGLSGSSATSGVPPALSSVHGMFMFLGS